MMRLQRLIHYPWRPRFYYGWVMAPIATIGMMCTAPAQTFGVSVFTPFIRASLDLTPAQVAAAYMAGTFLASLPLTWIGMYMDRYGPRLTLFVITLCFTSACVLLSQATGVILLFAAFFMLRLFGNGALSMVSTNTLAYWFNRRLGFMAGLKAMGMAAAIAMAPRFHYILIEQFGWRTAYLLLGILISIVLLPLTLLLYRNRPEDIGQRMDGDPACPESSGPIDSQTGLEGWLFQRVVRTRSYWIAAACVALWALIGTAVAFCTPALFESRGLEAGAAAERTTKLFTAMGITLLATNVFAGMMADRVRLNRLLCAGMLALSAVVFLLRMPGSENFVIAVGCMLGVTQAMVTAVSATLWVRYFGRRELGRIRGSIATILVAASSVGPFIVDGIASLVGSYQGVLTGLALTPIPLAVAALFADKPGAIESAGPDPKG